jgi:hypothetical protein
MSTIKVDTIATRTGSGTISLNHTGSSGPIFTFNHEGSAVGTIQERFDAIQIGTGETNLLFNNGSNEISPSASTGGVRDNTTDLGANNRRWKDIYVGSSIRIGGTGTANALDDYEEGDWTPTLTGSSSNPTVSAYQYQKGKYTKIGRTVHAHIYLRIAGGDMSGGSGDGRITGLPFASSNTDTLAFGAGGFATNWMKSGGSFSANRNRFKPIVPTGSAVFELWQFNGTSDQYDTGWGITQIVAGDLIVSGVFTYLTNA